MRLQRRLLDFANAIISPVGVQLYRAGMDMESELKVLSKVAKPIGTVMDIGASTGRWSAAALSMFPNTRFIGIDPLKEREPSLAKLKQNNSRFDYVLCAAGEQANSTVDLGVMDDLDSSTVGDGKGKMRTVPSYSLDAIAEMKQCKGPYLLKFDTHGFEVPIMNGAAKVLSETNYIVMEVYNYRHVEGTLLFHEMCALLDSKGFRVFNMADAFQRPVDRALWQMDLFFARKDDVFFRSEVYS